MQLLTLLLSASPLLAHAGHSSDFLSRSRAHSKRHVQPRANKSWKLQDNYQGQSFFDGWDFFTYPGAWRRPHQAA